MVKEFTRNNRCSVSLKTLTSGRTTKGMYSNSKKMRKKVKARSHREKGEAIMKMFFDVCPYSLIFLAYHLILFTFTPTFVWCEQTHRSMNTERKCYYFKRIRIYLITPSETNCFRKFAFAFALAFAWCEWTFTLLKRWKVGRRKVRKICNATKTM